MIRKWLCRLGFHRFEHEETIYNTRVTQCSCGDVRVVETWWG